MDLTIWDLLGAVVLLVKQATTQCLQGQQLADISTVWPQLLFKSLNKSQGSRADPATHIQSLFQDNFCAPKVWWLSGQVQSSHVVQRYTDPDVILPKTAPHFVHALQDAKDKNVDELE